MSMTIAEKLVQDAENWHGVENTKDLLFDSIAAKGVLVPVDAKLADTPALVASIQSGGGETVYHEVMFVDFDGFVISRQQVAHGTAAIAPASVPDVQFTEFYGWLDDYSNVTDELVVFIDRRLIDDTVTRIFVTMNSLSGLSLYVLFSIAQAGTVIIDYGDGYVLTLPQGTPINTTTVPQYTYANEGDYIISISGTAKISTQNSISGLASSSSYVGLIRANNTTDGYAVRKTLFGSNIYQILSFKGHRYCKAILMPRTVWSSFLYSYNVFERSYFLKCLIIPDGLTGSAAIDIMSPCLSFIRYPDSWVNHSGASLTQSPYINTNSSFISQKCHIRARWDLMNDFVTGIGSYGYNSNIKSLSSGIATQIGIGCFYNNKSFKKLIINSNLKKIANSAFSGSGLEEIQGDITSLTHVYQYAFKDTPLKGIFNFSETAQVNIGCFDNTCVSEIRVSNFIEGAFSIYITLSKMPCLEVIDYRTAASSYSDTPYILNAPILRAVILRNVTPPTIGLTTWSDGQGGFHNVYVPDSSWDSYIVATNWVAIYNAGKLHKISEL